MNSQKKIFGKIDGKDVYLYTFENDKGIKFNITNYGGIITHLFVPDKNGKSEDIVLGFDNLDQYLAEHPYFGCLIGRFGNRIGNGKFSLEGKNYTLAQNNDINHLHGGLKGFDKVVWNIKNEITKEGAGLELEYISKDGEEGYPGTLTVNVKNYINNNNELIFEYSAKTDKITIVNLTHHGYFNLNGMKSDIKNHLMQINADKITEVNDKLIPTGKFVEVGGTAFDFRKPRKIGEKISEAGGYDHNYIINKKDNSLSLASVVTEPESGRVMETYTTQPGVQFYSSNFLDGTISGKNKITYKKHFALCLETQHFPDSPNKAHFPSTVLKPGEKYSQTTTYKFKTL